MLSGEKNVKEKDKRKRKNKWKFEVKRTHSYKRGKNGQNYA
jgi:hypothetical protein